MQIKLSSSNESRLVNCNQPEVVVVNQRSSLSLSSTPPFGVVFLFIELIIKQILILLSSATTMVTSIEKYEWI